MKKLLILIFALVLLLSFCIGAHAEEFDNSEDIITEQTPGENAEELPPEASDDAPTAEPDLPPDEVGAGGVDIDTVFTRVLEWWKTNSEEIMAVGGFIITGIFTAFGKFLSNKISKIGDRTEKKIEESYGSSAAKTNELVEAYNDVVDVLVALKERLSELCEKIGSLEQKTLETEEIEESIARILTTAYTNSRLPNGTKDMINTECAQIISKVHGNSTAEPVPVVTEDTEDEKQD